MGRVSKKLRIKFRLILFDNGKRILGTTSHKKIKILHIAERTKHNKSYIKVDYGSGCNESFHYSLISLKKALNAYTEKSLIEFIGGQDGL